MNIVQVVQNIFEEEYISSYLTDLTFHLGKDSTLPWEDAIMACRNKGMRLAVLSSAMHMAATVEFLNTQP